MNHYHYTKPTQFGWYLVDFVQNDISQNLESWNPTLLQAADLILAGHNNLACALVMLGLSSQPMNTPLVQQGLQAAEQAITLAPHVPLYWRNAAVLLSLAGDQSASGPQIPGHLGWHG